MCGCVFCVRVLFPFAGLVVLLWCFLLFGLLCVGGFMWFHICSIRCRLMMATTFPLDVPLTLFLSSFSIPPPLNRSSPPHIGYILIPTYNLYKTLISLKESREESKGGERRAVQNWSPRRPAGPTICWSPAGRPRQANFYQIRHKNDHKKTKSKRKSVGPQNNSRKS